MEDRAFLDAIFWNVEEEGEKSYGIKLAESLITVLFRHQYGVRYPDEIGGENYTPDSSSVD